MSCLDTSYLGIALRNPLIAGSCTLTSNVDSAKRLEAAGAGAIVVRSIFEEQIRRDAETLYSELEYSGDAAAYEYLNADFPMLQRSETYFKRLSDIKNAVEIPVFASVNCRHLKQWKGFAERVQASGVDALEVNLYDIPDDIAVSGTALEQRHLDIVAAILGEVQLPVAVKLSCFYSSIPNMLAQFVALGVRGLVLFNRFLQPDIDVETLGLQSGLNYSRPDDIRLPLRWTALTAKLLNADICLSSGVHDAAGAAKAILAGAAAFQVCSTLYLHGETRINTLLSEFSGWMDEHGFAAIDDVKGRLAAESLEQARGFERAQYVQMIGSLE